MARMLALPSLRLICDQGRQLGVMTPQQARDEAAKRGRHLREVQASSEPPVWKLVARPSMRGQGDRAGDHDRARLGSQQTKPRMKEAKVKEVHLPAMGLLLEYRSLQTFHRCDLWTEVQTAT